MRPIREAMFAAFAVMAFAKPLQAQEGVSGYQCRVSNAYMLKNDDLVKQPQGNLYTMFGDFVVERATGRMSGSLHSGGGKAIVFDDAARPRQYYKVAYVSEGPGPYTQARYLAIQVYDSGPSKSFILVDGTSVMAGTCTLVK